MICDALDIVRGTCYNHILRNKRDNTWYAKRWETLRIQIQEVFDENSQIFGERKITAGLRNNGVKVSETMVRELMNDIGLVSIRYEAKKLYGDEIPRHKNYLNQEFDPDSPNQVWVSDVTYFKCNGKTYYICVIIDLYGSKTLNDYIKTLGVTRSFSRLYVSCENSVIESFFASLKREKLYRKKYIQRVNYSKLLMIILNFTTYALLMPRSNTRLLNKGSVNIQQYSEILIMSNRIMRI